MFSFFVLPSLGEEARRRGDDLSHPRSIYKEGFVYTLTAVHSLLQCRIPDILLTIGTYYRDNSGDEARYRARSTYRQ